MAESPAAIKILTANDEDSTTVSESPAKLKWG
jgi:hypothetical protein